MPEAFEIGRLVPRKTKAVILRKPYEDSCFASGNGSNFEAIAAAFPRKIAGQLSLVFCDQPEAYVLTRAQKRKIPVVCFSPSDFSSREQYEEQVLKHLKEHQIDLIVLVVI